MPCALIEWYGFLRKVCGQPKRLTISTRFVMTTGLRTSASAVARKTEFGHLSRIVYCRVALCGLGTITKPIRILFRSAIAMLDISPHLKSLMRPILLNSRNDSDQSGKNFERHHQMRRDNLRGAQHMPTLSGGAQRSAELERFLRHGFVPAGHGLRILLASARYRGADCRGF